MTPNFPETNQALYHTLYYFKIGRIATQIKKMAGELNLTYLDSYYEITLQSHKGMESELNQNAIGSIPFIQLSLFEFVRDWLNNWQFNSGFENEIEYLIDEENEKEEQRYKIEIENDEIEYKKSIPPGVAEGEEYEVIIPSFYNFFSRQKIEERKEKKVNKFVTQKKPDLIDKTYLSEYLSLVKNLTDSFRRYSEKYLVNFFAGKYPVHSQQGLVTASPKHLEAPTIQISTAKLKVNMSVKRFQYLFKILIDADIIKQPVLLKELHEFFAASFYTDRSEDLSIEKLQKNWSEIKQDPKIAAYWMDKFISLEKLAKKDNPNNIK